jgi:hypothetical protein
VWIIGSELVEVMGRTGKMNRKPSQWFQAKPAMIAGDKIGFHPP